MSEQPPEPAPPQDDWPEGYPWDPDAHGGDEDA